MFFKHQSVIDRDLWSAILAFDLDQPLGEYSFSTRLAAENQWTRRFTEKAILEYKRFMYLAGTSDFMVAPSGVVDIVWHQHLIYTQSYTAFCQVIGRNIQHIPSTHHVDERDRFRQARERTAQRYLEVFGSQSEDIWNHDSMLDSLQLPKSRMKLRTGIIIGILALLILVVPFYAVLKPVYVHIDNPYFLTVYIALIILAFFLLEWYNRTFLLKMVKEFHSSSFVFALHPLEMVYLERMKLPYVVHGIVDRYIDQGSIKVRQQDNTLEVKSGSTGTSVEEYTVLQSLSSLGHVPYQAYMKLLMLKPVVRNIEDSMDAFKKYIVRSVAFSRMFFINFGVLCLLLSAGFERYLTGISRDKPVIQIGIVLLVLLLAAGAYLWRLTHLIGTHTLPGYYRNFLLPAQNLSDHEDWQYFMGGITALTSAFIPMVQSIEGTGANATGSDSSCSSCGSSCGSSCSSCGGCGGGD